MTEGAGGGAAGDRFALYDLFAGYGALIDAAEFDAWLALFAAACTYHIMPLENYERRLPAGARVLRQPGNVGRPHPRAA